MWKVWIKVKGIEIKRYYWNIHETFTSQLSQNEQRHYSVISQQVDFGTPTHTPVIVY